MAALVPVLNVRLTWAVAVIPFLCRVSGEPAGNPSPLFVSTVFSTAQQSSRSFLRFYNVSDSDGTVTVTLRDSESGQSLAQWTSPNIPAGAEHQFPIETIENVIGQIFVKPDYYSISIESDLVGYFQHVLWRSIDGTLTNLSMCASEFTSDSNTLGGVPSSLLESSYGRLVAVFHASLGRCL